MIIDTERGQPLPAAVVAEMRSTGYGLALSRRVLSFVRCQACKRVLQDRSEEDFLKADRCPGCGEEGTLLEERSDGERVP